MAIIRDGYLRRGRLILERETMEDAGTSYQHCVWFQWYCDWIHTPFTSEFLVLDLGFTVLAFAMLSGLPSSGQMAIFQELFSPTMLW